MSEPINNRIVEDTEEDVFVHDVRDVAGAISVLTFADSGNTPLPVGTSRKVRYILII